MVASRRSGGLSDLADAVRPVRGAQLALEDLARAGLGKLVEPRDGTRHLVAREVFTCERVPRILVECRAGTLDDDRVYEFAPVVARNAEHGGFVDVGMSF